MFIKKPKLKTPKRTPPKPPAPKPPPAPTVKEQKERIKSLEIPKSLKTDPSKDKPKPRRIRNKNSY